MLRIVLTAPLHLSDLADALVYSFVWGQISPRQCGRSAWKFAWWSGQVFSPLGGVIFMALHVGKGKGASWACSHLTSNISKTLSRSVTCQLELTRAYGSNWQLDESFLKCKSSAVAPRDSIYKQKYVAFFSILCNIIFDKRETSHHKKTSDLVYGGQRRSHCLSLKCKKIGH